MFISQPKNLCNWLLYLSFNQDFSFFFRHGQKVAQKPHLYIGLCFIVSGLFAIGLLNYQPEANPYKLWIPKNSDYVQNTDWLWKNYPPDSRYNEQLLIKLLKWDAFSRMNINFCSPCDQNLLISGSILSSYQLPMSYVLMYCNMWVFLGRCPNNMSLV